MRSGPQVVFFFSRQSSAKDSPDVTEVLLQSEGFRSEKGAVQISNMLGVSFRVPLAANRNGCRCG